MSLDFNKIILKAWDSYGDSRKIKRITDISVKVSTNGVYKLDLDDKNILFAKFSYFGKHESFSNDHKIINALSNNLGLPFDRFLARSLMKGNKLYIYRYRDSEIDASLVFYLPVKINQRPPKIFNEFQISKLGRGIASFHLSCDHIRNTLPKAGKTIFDDIRSLKIDLKEGNKYFISHAGLIKDHIDLFAENCNELNYESFHKIPVFLDWNIGNFSINENFSLFSRWDFDWFRIDSRIFDFYFLSRVVSSVGDRSVFTYGFDILKEERFLHFLKNYHEVYPLTHNELHFIKESYRFFLLNYVIRGGRRFFHESFSEKLQKEAFDFLPLLDKNLDTNIYIKALNL